MLLSHTVNIEKLSIRKGNMTVYKLPDLNYDYSELEPNLSAEILELHHSKHHAAYVAGANTTLEQLETWRSTEDASPALLNALEKNLAFHVSGHVLHSLFWENLSPTAKSGGGEPEGDLIDQINSDFGSFANFQKQFNATANGVQGSGWAALSWEPTAGKLVITQVFDHQSNLQQLATPLLVLDMWEHAFYLQYKNVKGDWVTNWWNIINWSDVATKLSNAR
jgi:Fe-Mn family superoxide dismutase